MNSFFETSKKPSKKRWRRFFAWTFRTLFKLGLATLLIVAVGLVGLYAYLVNGYEDQLERRYPDLVQNSRVYDADGEEIATFPAEQNRETVGPDALGEYLTQATAAIEDRRFYEHVGVDFEGLGRAAWTDLRSWSVQEGGSTITEQLAKNLFVPEEQWMEVSFWRRLNQSALAFAYERRHTKEEILTAYLNTVYFGEGAYGAELAAERYFGKDARDLTLSESAALAGFLHAPSTYAPEVAGSARRAEGRRNEVLAIMRQEGMISPSERREAASQPLEFAPDEAPDDPVYEPFLDRVRREVQDEIGEEALVRGGLRIETTIRPNLQRAAVESAGEVLSEPDDPSAAVATVEPQSGAIRALAGQEGDFNLALDARRQPGSSFKPLVLATALRNYISPDTVYVSKDLNVNFQGLEYPVVNYDFVERGPITVNEAMVESDNTVFVQFGADLGLANVAGTAEAMGVTTPVEAYPSTAIGGLGTGVSVLDMASSYATFAGAGIYREPYAVETVDRLDFGEEEQLYDHPVSGNRVLSGNQAAVATDVLRDMVEDDEATAGHDLDEELGRPSAGKTGTTDDFVDAWYVGYTRRLSTAVWVGYPEGRRSMVEIHGLEEVNGRTLPLDIWADYMDEATSGAAPLNFPEADYSEFFPLESGYAADPPATSYLPISTSAN
ncbi:MAG TPA: transglycosylase domain-containing protein [Rubrobacteraceae bacterium]|nr:transglycosylase domain-containing protein [Rubrobacteraceae bacterium]